MTDTDPPTPTQEGRKRRGDDDTETEPMDTAFLLMARHRGLPVIPLETVCRDYFRHLTPEHYARKALAGEDLPPIVRMDGSQKTARGVHINDLAAHLDRAAERARKEAKQLRQAG